MENLLPWYIAGPLIGLSVPVLLILKNKQLGMSSGLRWFASWIPFSSRAFVQSRAQDFWQVKVGVGVVLAGIFFRYYSLLPSGRDFDETVYQLANAFPLFFGALVLGFGARLAGGCTAGHCIMGNSQFSMASLLSTIGFFIGGLFASNFLVDQILLNP